MNLAYYPGCSLRQSASLLDKQTLKVFQTLGIYLQEIEDWNCCGSTSATKADEFLEVAMPARNIGLAEKSGFSEMVIPCSACYSKTVMALYRLQEDPELKSEINAQLSCPVEGKLRISSILDCLEDLNKAGRIANLVQKKLEGLNPACYYGCMLSRFPQDIPIRDDQENPQFMENILKTLGCSPLDWNKKTSCCGASAIFYDQNTCLNLMAKIFEDAHLRGANCFVTTCPVCQMNLDFYQAKIREITDISKPLPVFFLTELLGYALGINTYDLDMDKHMIDGTKLIKKLENHEQFK